MKIKIFLAICAISGFAKATGQSVVGASNVNFCDMQGYVNAVLNSEPQTLESFGCVDNDITPTPDQLGQRQSQLRRVFQTQSPSLVAGDSNSEATRGSRSNSFTIAAPSDEDSLANDVEGYSARVQGLCKFARCNCTVERERPGWSPAENYEYHILRAVPGGRTRGDRTWMVGINCQR